MRSTREGAVKSAASPDIHSRCWLDLVEPGPVTLGAGFSCLFLQVWCLMLIPPHVPWVLSKHTRAGDSASRPALPPARLSLPSPPLVAHPPTLQEQQPASPLLLTCHQSCCPERLCVASLQASCPLSSFNFLFHAFPHSFKPLSPPGFKRFWRGVMFTLPLRGLCYRLGQASCCSSNSIALNGDIGRIKLVIFQAWSVLGQYAIRER